MPEIRGSTFDLHTALWLAEEREVNMLACIDVLGKENGGALHVAELPRALKSLELCEGITHEQVQRVVERTAASLGHTQTSRLSHDACVLYYNALVEFVNSYEARLANPSQNCTPQYTVAGLDMPPCFWINLERGADRRANMRRLLQGYRHTRVPAVDAQAGAWLDECAALGLDRPLRATAAERCCTMSHVRALEAIAAAGVPLALVLEDDVTFKFIHPSFSFERTVADLPADWDVLHISARSNPPSKLLSIPFQFCEWRPKLCYSTAAFLVNGARIASILARVRTALLAGTEARADWVLYGSVKTYVLTRPVIDEDPFGFSSAIHSENEEYHRRMHVALSELYCNEMRAELGLPEQPLTYAKGFSSSDQNAQPRGGGDAQPRATPAPPPPPRPLLSADDFRAIRAAAAAAAPAAAAPATAPEAAAAPATAAEGAIDPRRDGDASQRRQSQSQSAGRADEPAGQLAGPVPALGGEDQPAERGSDGVTS